MASKKVLVIDDDVAFNETLKEQLEFANYEVACAFDGEQGLLMFEQFQPDVVITDVIMPRKDGIEILMALTGDDSIQCQIVVISGGGRVAGAEYLRLVENLGVRDVLEKPFAFAELERLIS